MNQINSQHVKTVFGKNVKYYRFLKKLTQEQLAEKIDIDITSISDIECGARGVQFETIAKLCNTLEVKVSQLFDEEILDKNIPNDIRDFYMNQ